MLKMMQQKLEAKLLRIEALAREAMTKPDGARVEALVTILKIAIKEA
jgi:hypothetical protein